MSPVRSFFSRLRPWCLLASVAATGLFVGCGRGGQQSSDLEGFSAHNGAATKNVAVLMTAYASTPGYASMFEQDLANFARVISDPKGNYRFDAQSYRQVGHNGMEANIRDAAAKVSTDGTLLVFITAHGSPSGTIQPEGQAYATFGYQNVLASIRAGRKDKGPIQRLVLVISACYSGSWLSTLAPSDDVVKQRLVMTSVDAGNLSQIGSATSAVYQAFQKMKDHTGDSMSQFLATAKSYSGGMLQYNVNDQALLSEPFLNKEQ